MFGTQCVAPLTALWPKPTRKPLSVRSHHCHPLIGFIRWLYLFQPAARGRWDCAEDMWLWNSMWHSDPHDQQQRKCSVDGPRGIWRQVWVAFQVAEKFWMLALPNCGRELQSVHVYPVVVWFREKKKKKKRKSPQNHRNSLKPALVCV